MTPLLTFVAVFALAAAGLLTGAATLKLARFEDTVEWVRILKIPGRSGFLAGVATGGEFLLGALFLFMPNTASVAAALWMIGLTIVLARAYRLNAGCGCFGNLGEVRWFHFLRNLLMFAAFALAAAVPAVWPPMELAFAILLLSAFAVLARPLLMFSRMSNRLENASWS